jgi:hypothetical protein
MFSKFPTNSKYGIKVYMVWDSKHIFHKQSRSFLWETERITSYLVANKLEDTVNRLTGDVGTDSDLTIDNLFTTVVIL